MGRALVVCLIAACFGANADQAEGPHFACSGELRSDWDGITKIRALDVELIVGPGVDAQWIRIDGDWGCATVGARAGEFPCLERLPVVATSDKYTHNSEVENPYAHSRTTVTLSRYTGSLEVLSMMGSSPSSEKKSFTFNSASLKCRRIQRAF